MEKYQILATALFKIKMGYILTGYDKNMASVYRADLSSNVADLFKKELCELREEFLKEHRLSKEDVKAIELFNIQLKKKFIKNIVS